MEVSVIGINHRTATVDVREQFSLPGDQAGTLLRAIRTERIFVEAAVLDTCNRTEIYFVAGSGEDQVPHLLEHVAELKGTPPLAIGDPMFYRHRGLDAVDHLFRVCAGLDSMILGENEIVGQVRATYRLATSSRTAGFVLNKLFHRAFRVGKRVRAETELSAGSASVAQGAVELAGHVFASLEGKAVLLVGAGQTAELAARALIRAGAETLIVANRTLSRAQQLAEELTADHLAEIGTGAACEPDHGSMCPALRRLAPDCNVGEHDPAALCKLTTRAIGLGDIADVLGDVDLVISSTGASEPVLTYDALAEKIWRGNRTLLMVDIAVPRDIDERLGGLSNVFLYNIDDLQRLVNQTIDRRRQEVPRADAVIEHEVNEFRRWIDSQQVVPTIKGLQEMMAGIRQAEMARYGRKFTAAEREQVERFTEGLCKRIFHQPFTYLRRLSDDDSSSEVMAAVSLLRQIFELDAAEALENE